MKKYKFQVSLDFLKKLSKNLKLGFLKNMKLTTKLSIGFLMIFILLVAFLAVQKVSNKKLIGEFNKTKVKVENIKENNSKAVLIQISSTTLTNIFFKNIMMLIDTSDINEAKSFLSEGLLGLENFSETFNSVNNDEETLKLVELLKNGINLQFCK